MAPPPSLRIVQGRGLCTTGVNEPGEKEGLAQGTRGNSHTRPPGSHPGLFLSPRQCVGLTETE